MSANPRFEVCPKCIKTRCSIFLCLLFRTYLVEIALVGHLLIFCVIISTISWVGISDFWWWTYVAVYCCISWLMFGVRVRECRCVWHWCIHSTAQWWQFDAILTGTMNESYDKPWDFGEFSGTKPIYHRRWQATPGAHHRPVLVLGSDYVNEAVPWCGSPVVLQLVGVLNPKWMEIHLGFFWGE